ncbi:alpha/beta hydrolase [Rhodanobacter sp. 7MK24]|uniref:alpha/beta hydrolase n=1 Tax=Rhodanobacter sp. 7MK24 TaxID=2775922 RepID=UPI00177F9085|nr:alpha/beta hydrolase [Rhodanobacter sp. 7MK24]MBD8879917.1 alpha/beta hydrolase [Rhodanobacter sp. 7MK24]
MKTWLVFFGLLFACVGTHAAETVWQPSAGHLQMSLWPGTPPDMKTMPGPEYAALRKEHLIAGKPWLEVANVSWPTMTIYPPQGKNTGAAVVVFPGGGFEVLAIDLEGTEICDWLTSRGITCVLLKYRVPGAPYDWHCKCRPDDYEVPTMALEDVQRTMGLVRLHAKAWNIDPHKVGVVGFSAGGFLVAEISTHFGTRLYKPVDEADRESARPDFAMAIYPGHLALENGKLNPNVPVTHDTPPTFVVQAEDDNVDGVQQALTYFAALKAADVPTEMHLYAHGGHAFGVRRTDMPITHWTDLADAWMRTIGVLPR